MKKWPVFLSAPNGPFPDQCRDNRRHGGQRPLEPWANPTLASGSHAAAALHPPAPTIDPMLKPPGPAASPAAQGLAASQIIGKSYMPHGSE